MQGHRTFTGDANIRPGSMDSPPGDAGPQRTSSTAVPAKQPASTQSAFNMGSGAAPISPSKKRAHRDLKMRQTAASSPSMQAAKANPFAPYGVHSDSSNLSSKDPAQRSPGKAQPSPSRVKVTLKAPNGAQGMRIDSGSAPLHKATSFGLSFTAAAPNAAERLSSNHATTAQPSKNPVPAGTTSSSTGFPSTAVPANPLSNHHATSASTAFEPAASGASSSPMASSANPDSTNIGARPTLAPTAATSPAAVTPPSFCFSSSHRTNAGASSPQVPFQGFGAAGATQSANGTPSASFAGLQPGMQSRPVACPVVLSLPCWRFCYGLGTANLVDGSRYEVLLADLAWHGGGACLVLRWQSHGSCMAPHIAHWLIPYDPFMVPQVCYHLDSHSALISICYDRLCLIGI